MLYASKWPSASLGERNQAAFRHSAQLLNDFGADEGQAWELVEGWNATNTPPLEAKELRAAFDSAKSHAKRPPGCLFGSPIPTKQSPTVPEPVRDAMDSLRSNITGIIDGKITVIDFPWPVLGELTQALIGGTVTTLCGPKGSTKTFLVLQCLSHWILAGIKAAVLVLEEDTTHCMKRVLAQLSGEAHVTDLKWVAANEIAATQLLIDHDEALKKIGANIWDTPDNEMSMSDIAGWVEARAKENYRIVMVDPITASTQSREPWIHDAKFINEVKRIARRYDVSVILTTHPKKGGSHEIDMDSLAGSSAQTRFAQTVLWLSAHDRDKSVTVRTTLGRMAMPCNRTLHVLAARNGIGRGSRIAFNFSAKTLRFEEVGLVIHEAKEKQNDE
jgi:KaiC/GvpD/RAD55 family RecA-like ATPase